MQRTWRRHLIALSALILLPAAGLATAAEIEQGTWEPGVFIAYTNYANQSTLDDSITFGGRVAYFFRAKHGLEFSINAGSTDINTQGLDTEFDLTKVYLNYIHNFHMKKASRMMPLITLGFGKFDVDDGTNSGWRTTLQFGAGSRVSLTPHMALRFDLTVFRWRGDGIVTPPDSYYSFDITAGFSFFIGAGT